MKLTNRARVKLKPPVEAGSVVVPIGKIVRRRKESDIVQPPDIAFESDDTDVGILIEEPLGAANNAERGAEIASPLAAEQRLAFVYGVISWSVVGCVKNAKSILCRDAQ